MTCEHLNTCSFIHHMTKNLPFTVNMMKIKFCEFDKTKCARYRLAKICYLEMIPYDLWPSDDTKALEFLESKLNEAHKKHYGCSREELPA